MKIVFFAKVPPPYGGGEIRSRLVADFLDVDNSFRVVRLHAPGATKANQGRLVLSKLYTTAIEQFKMIKTIVRYLPDRVFFSLPKSRTAFIKFVPFLIIAKILRIDIYTELAGDRLYFEPNSLEKYIFKAITSIRLLSNSIQSKFENYGISSTSVFPNSSDIRGFDRYSDGRQLENYVLHVGTLSPEKGVDDLLTAFVDYKKSSGKLNLRLIGSWISKDYEEHIKTKYEKYFSSCEIHAFSADRDLIAQNLAQAKGVYLLSRREGLPISLIEACYFNVRIVCSDVGFVNEWFQHYEGFNLVRNNNEIVESFRYVENCDVRVDSNYFHSTFSMDIFLNRYKNWLME